MRVVALPTDIAESLRASLRDPHYGYPAFEEVATGYGPCRHCLRRFEVGVDRRVLFTHDPFAGLERLPLPGPIFVHAQACDRYSEDAGFPDELRTHALTFNAYASGRRLIEEAYVFDGNVDQTIERLLTLTEVAYIHVRDTQAGCYDFRIERP